MKQFEIEKFRSGSRVNIEGVILKSLAVLGVLGVVTVAVLAPNALQMIAYFDKERRRKKNPKYVVTEAITRLERKGLIKKAKNGQFRLSKEGARRLHLIEYGTYPPPTEKWDKKWRIVSFDVGEERKRSREQLRLLLQQVGFVRLQDSVWVYPYDVEEVIDLIKTANFLDKEVLYMTVSTTGKDVELKKKFELT